MKPVSLVVLFLMIFFLYDVSSANGDQVAWRWRNDDGNVYTATWKDSVNTAVVVTQQENIRLRIEDLVGDANSSLLSLRYTEDPYGESWIPVTGVDTGKFVISPSAYLTDGMSYGDNQLLPPFDPANVYRRTVVLDSSIGYVLYVEGSSIYEVEYSMRPTTKIQPGSAYFFSCFLGDAPMRGVQPLSCAVLLTPPVNWRSQSVGKWCILNDVSFVDANNGTAVGIGPGGSVGTIFRTVDGGKTWVNQPVPPCEPLNAVDFPNVGLGIAVGSNGTVLRTTDGGENWVALPNLRSDRYLANVAFSDTAHGVIVGSDQNGRGVIRRTTDGGQNWDEQVLIYTAPLLSVCLTSPDAGIVVGESGTILRTTNGGASWIVQPSGTTNGLCGAAFTDANNGTVVGGGWGPKEGTILRTTDGGSTWKESANAGAHRLNSVWFADKSIGWAVGEGGWILKTTDGGLSWKRLTSGTHKSLLSVRFVDRETGWVVGRDGTILATANGGTTSSVDQKHVDGAPTESVLLQNYPNPFNPVTTIQFTIVRQQWTSVGIYDVLGREVTTLVNEQKPPGTYTVTFDGSNLPSGVYLCRLVAGEFRRTMRMMIVK